MSIANTCPLFALKIGKEKNTDVSLVEELFFSFGRFQKLKWNGSYGKINEKILAFHHISHIWKITTFDV